MIWALDACLSVEYIYILHTKEPRSLFVDAIARTKSATGLGHAISHHWYDSYNFFVVA